MAFVIRSPKNLENSFEKNETEEFPLVKIIREQKEHKTNNNVVIGTKAIFGSKAERTSFFLDSHSPAPGPGTYKNKSNLIKKTFNPNNTSPNEYQKGEENSSQIFISKDKRFHDEVYDNKVPGPGKYIMLEKSKDKNVNKRDIFGKLRFPIFDTFSSERSLSIPNKDEEDSFGTKENTIGPGSYDIKLFNRKNNSIDWSKSMKKTENRKDIRNQSTSTKHLGPETITNTITEPNSGSVTNPNNINEINNYFFLNKKKNVYENEIYSTIINDKEKMIDRLRMEERFCCKGSDSPGPGDYFIPDEFDLLAREHRNKINFGSSVCRGLIYPIKKNKIQIGKKTDNHLIVQPTIFSSNNNSDALSKKIKNKNKNNLTILKGSSNIAEELKEKYIMEKNKKSSWLGPGSYDPPLNLNTNIGKSLIQNFGSLETRFPTYFNQETPGAGSYLRLDTWSQKRKLFRASLPPNILKKINTGIDKDTLTKILKEKNTFPCLGQYSSDSNGSIETELKNILKKNANIRKGFSGEKRFFSFESQYNFENGVGKYNIGSKNKDFIQQRIPFLSGCEKDGNGNGVINSIKIEKSQRGPGQYRYDSYFDWNKKSFNKLFA